jgi:hypothetical protein
MTRTEWRDAFILELQRLRPHLSTKLLDAIATMRWPSDKDRDPKASAQAYHDSQTPPAAKKRR